MNFLPDKTTDNAKPELAGLFVPKAAVLEADGRTTVWRIDPDKTIHRTTILTTPRSDDLVKVEDGLKAGQRIVLNPMPELQENQAVTVPD